MKHWGRIAEPRANGQPFQRWQSAPRALANKHFAVSVRTASCNFQLAASILVPFVQGARSSHGDIDRLAFVGGVKRIDKFAFFVEQGELSGGGSAVYAKVYAECFRKVSLFKCGFCLGQLMAFIEDGTLCVGFEEGLPA